MMTKRFRYIESARIEAGRAHLDNATKCSPMERGAGTPRELAAETAALRSAGVLACEFWQRPAASLVVVSRCAPPYLNVSEFVCHSTGMCLVVWLALISPVRAQDGVATLAGQALVSGSTNGYSTNALFNDPAALVTDPAGNLFVADSQNHAIRKISANGLVTMLAGQLGVPGSGDETGAQARFDSPCGVTLDRNGNLFVSDTGNHTIRKITPAGVVTTIAGRAGQSGFADGPSSSALFNSPLGIAVAPNGTIYVADSGNHVIRAISAGGTVTTLAGSAENWGSENGSGTNARFNGPVGLALDDQESLFVADSNNHTIRRITPDGAVSTWAGVPGVDGCVDGDAPSAKFCKPAELAIDRKNNLFVADSFNHVIRRITPSVPMALCSWRMLTTN